jgi:hypothetical protein
MSRSPDNPSMLLCVRLYTVERAVERGGEAGKPARAEWIYLPSVHESCNESEVEELVEELVER